MKLLTLTFFDGWTRLRLQVTCWPGDRPLLVPKPPGQGGGFRAEYIGAHPLYEYVAYKFTKDEADLFIYSANYRGAKNKKPPTEFFGEEAPE